MYDAKLPFGHARSPKIFQQLSASVCSIMKCTYKVTCIAYLDDFLVIADSFSKCQRGIRLLIHTLRELGFNISWNKIEGPSQSLDKSILAFLLFTFDKLSIKRLTKVLPPLTI
jgi:hypothetical protein